MGQRDNVNTGEKRLAGKLHEIVHACYQGKLTEAIGKINEKTIWVTTTLHRKKAIERKWAELGVPMHLFGPKAYELRRFVEKIAMPDLEGMKTSEENINRWIIRCMMDTFKDNKIIKPLHPEKSWSSAVIWDTLYQILMNNIEDKELEKKGEKGVALVWLKNEFLKQLEKMSMIGEWDIYRRARKKVSIFVKDHTVVFEKNRNLMKLEKEFVEEMFDCADGNSWIVVPWPDKTEDVIKKWSEEFGYVRFPDRHEEAHSVVGAICQTLKYGARPEEIGLVVASNKAVPYIEKAARRMNIPILPPKGRLLGSLPLGVTIKKLLSLIDIDTDGKTSKIIDVEKLFSLLESQYVWSFYLIKRYVDEKSKCDDGTECIKEGIEKKDGISISDTTPNKKTFSFLSDIKDLMLKDGLEQINLSEELNEKTEETKGIDEFRDVILRLLIPMLESKDAVEFSNNIKTVLEGLGITYAIQIGLNTENDTLPASMAARAYSKLMAVLEAIQTNSGIKYNEIKVAKEYILEEINKVLVPSENIPDAIRAVAPEEAVYYDFKYLFVVGLEETALQFNLPTGLFNTDEIKKLRIGGDDEYIGFEILNGIFLHERSGNLNEEWTPWLSVSKMECDEEIVQHPALDLFQVPLIEMQDKKIPSNVRKMDPVEMMISTGRKIANTNVGITVPVVLPKRDMDKFRTGHSGANFISDLERGSGGDMIQTIRDGIAKKLVDTGVRGMGEDHNYSASQLQDWWDCPYKYFLKYVVGIEEPDEFTWVPEAKDVGTAVHKVLENLYEWVEVKYTTWGNIHNDMGKVYEKADELLKEHFKGIGGNIYVKTVSERFLKRTGENWKGTLANLIQKQIEWSEHLVPEDREKKFGKWSDLKGSQPFYLDEVKKVRFRGKIDRIDRFEKGPLKGKKIILDYKTGKPHDVGGITKMKKVQVPLYVYAMNRILGEMAEGDIPVVSGGFISLKPLQDIENILNILHDPKKKKNGEYYKNFRYVNKALEDFANTKMLELCIKIKELAVKAVKDWIRKGKFPPVVDEGFVKHCRWCEYAGACNSSFFALNENPIFFNQEKEEIQETGKGTNGGDEK